MEETSATSDGIADGIADPILYEWPIRTINAPFPSWAALLKSTRPHLRVLYSPECLMSVKPRRATTSPSAFMCPSRRSPENAGTPTMSL